MNYVCNGSYKSFVCLDFETTGLSGSKDNVTEIGAVKVLDGEVVQRFSTLVNPGRPIPPRVVALTGITNDMVEDYPRIHELLPMFLGFLGNLPLVCHNAKFDCKFLERDLCAMGRSIENPVDDTLQLSPAEAQGPAQLQAGIPNGLFQHRTQRRPPGLVRCRGHREPVLKTSGRIKILPKPLWFREFLCDLGVNPSASKRQWGRYGRRQAATPPEFCPSSRRIS